MRYFYLVKDEKCTNYPVFMNTKHGTDRLNRAVIKRMRTNDYTFFPDIIIGEQLLMNKELKDCMALLEPNMKSREWIIIDIDQNKNRHVVYYSFEIDKYSDLNSAPKDKSIVKVRVQEKNQDGYQYVIRQDAFECLYRRGLVGASIKEIKA